MYRTRLRNIMKIPANSARRMSWIAIERSEYQEKIFGACFEKYSLTKFGASIKTVLAKSSETATQNANGSLPTSSNLCRPPSMATHEIDCQIYELSRLGTPLCCFLPVNS
jgi:hypothetical protein